MKKRIFILFTIIFLISNLSYAELENDQWRDSKSTYLDLIKDGYEIKAYDISNFNDSFGNMYMFFVTVLQKEKDKSSHDRIIKVDEELKDLVSISHSETEKWKHSKKIIEEDKSKKNIID